MCTWFMNGPKRKGAKRVWSNCQVNILIFSQEDGGRVTFFFGYWVDVEKREQELATKSLNSTKTFLVDLPLYSVEILFDIHSNRNLCQQKKWNKF